MSKGSLWFASNAIIVGGGGLLEYGSKFSLLSAILGMGFGIWLLWVVEKIERSRNRGSTAVPR